MKKRIAIIISAALLCSVTAGYAAAYSLYSESSYAGAMADYPEQLSALNRNLSAAVSSRNGEDAPDTASVYGELLSLAQEYHLKVKENGAELSGKLMDYDVLLKRLKIAITRYDRRLARVSELELLAKTGSASPAELSAANDEVSAVYFGIREILFEISTLKSEIEGITGETLRDTFDFDNVYLVTDALSLGELSDNITLSTVCVPDGADGAALPERNYSADLNNAVEMYYDLGTALRDLVSAAADVKKAEEQQKLGQLTVSELEAVIEQREEKFLQAASAKAALSKALLTLDISSGGGLISGVSAGEASVIGRTLTGSGTGLWLVKCAKNGAALSPVIYPANTLPVDENDINRYTYSVSYNGRRIGSAACGSDCALSRVSYKDGVDTATVEFYKNGTLTKSYNIGIFTPYGKFLSN